MKILKYIMIILSTCALPFLAFADQSQKDLSNQNNQWRRYPNSALEYDPFREVCIMQHQMQQLFDEMEHSGLSIDFEHGNSLGMPKLDLREESDKYIALADLPGMDKAKIDITIENDNLLKISGTKDEVYQDDNCRYLHQERFSGYFERMIQLPKPVKASEIQAKYENGVLSIIIPKVTDEKQLSSKIQII